MSGATRKAARFTGVRPGARLGPRQESGPWDGLASPALVLSRPGMWMLAGRALAPWAAGAARLLPPYSRQVAVLEPGATRRPFSTAELKVTGSPGGWRWDSARARRASPSTPAARQPGLGIGSVSLEHVLLLEASEKLHLSSKRLPGFVC